MPGLTAGCSPVRCGGGAGGTVRLSVRSCVPGGSVSTVLLPCGVLVLLAVVWAELPALDRWVLGGPRSDRRRPAGRRGRRGTPGRRPGEPARRPLQLIAADLRRLSRQFALVPAGAPLV